MTAAQRIVAVIRRELENDLRRVPDSLTECGVLRDLLAEVERLAREPEPFMAEVDRQIEARENSREAAPPGSPLEKMHWAARED